jgi:hypothetical protein
VAWVFCALRLLLFLLFWLSPEADLRWSDNHAWIERHREIATQARLAKAASLFLLYALKRTEEADGRS